MLNNVTWERERERGHISLSSFIRVNRTLCNRATKLVKIYYVAFSNADVFIHRPLARDISCKVSSEKFQSQKIKVPNI